MQDTVLLTVNARCSGPVGQWGGTDEEMVMEVMVMVKEVVQVMVREVVPGTGDGQGGGSWRWSAMAMVREVVRSGFL